MVLKRRPTNRFVANATGLVAFAATLAALGLAGLAVAMLDSDAGGEARSPLLAVAVILAAAAAVGIAARLVAWLILKRWRPDGI